MSKLIIVLWVLSLSVLIFTVKKRRTASIKALKMSKSMMKNMVSNILGILLLIGLVQAFISTEVITDFLGASGNTLSVLIAGVVGSVTLIPAFVAFPLVASFVDAGVNTTSAVTFLTTLTMVGVVTIPLEKQEFGAKFTFLRNICSFIIAIAIAVVMGVVL